MKKKIFAVCMAAVVACSTCAFAAEEVEETAAAVEETAEETEAVEETAAAEEAAAAEESTAEISGLYIANYSSTSGQVNMEIISEPDLLSTAQEAGTAIYDFKEDGTAVVYKDGTETQGTYSAEDGKLVISTDEEKTYDYDIIDGLVVLKSGDESSILYGFSLNDMNYITLGDYSVIEVDEASAAITDEDVDSYINTVLTNSTTYNKVTEGTVDSGDIICLSYEAYIDGEDEPFESNADGLEFTLGSNVLVEGFEEQLIGQEIGKEMDVKVTLSEDSQSQAAGKDVTFKTTIRYKLAADTPELTDEFVQDFSEKYLTEKCETVDDFKVYVRAYLENYRLHNAMMASIASGASITQFNAVTANMLVQRSLSILSYYAENYGYDADTYAAKLGYESAEAYAENEALYYMQVSMIVNKLMVENDMSYTLEELDASLADYIKMGGYDMTVEEYKEGDGISGMWIYKNMEFKFEKIMKALEDRVVYVAADTAAEAE